MVNIKWTAAQDTKLLKLRGEGCSWEEIAEVLGKSVSACRHRSYTPRAVGANSSGNREQSEYTETKDGAVLSYVGRKITTPDELIKASKIDLDIWQVVEQSVNNWEVGGKIRQGQAESGRWKEEKLWKMPLLQIRIKLRRRAPKCVQDGIKGIMSRVPSWVKPMPKVKPVKKSADHLLEISLYDVHFGKLCLAAETGQNYDLRIAKADFESAVVDLLDRVSPWGIEKIVFPLGNDFFHVDGWQKMTAKGTVVDSTDDRFTKVFEVGYEAVMNSIMRCREVAPVEIIWVPGNHDPSTSWYLCNMIQKVFGALKDNRVTVDHSEKKRKYRRYGVNLIGWDHGECFNLSKLPMIMANEASDHWSQCTYKFYRVGHFHKNKEMNWVGNDTFHGVSVTILPSLSATDKWHFEQSYVGNHRAAEAALWNKHTGPHGYFPVEARSARTK
jgi:hypothetical protein